MTAAEKEQLQSELADFLEYARVINGAPLHLPPASHAVEKEQLLREDTAAPWSDRDAAPRQRARPAGGELPGAASGGERRRDDEREARPRSASATDYEVVIGLEVHAQLNTATKLFCSCPTGFGSEPNANTCPVCSGQPGALPVLNREAVTMAIMAGLAMGCTINRRSLFAQEKLFLP